MGSSVEGFAFTGKARRVENQVTEPALWVSYRWVSAFSNADNCPSSLAPFEANEELAEACSPLERTGLGSGPMFH